MHNTIRPKSAKLAWQHGLPKIRKVLEKFSSFRPVIDTTGATNYSVGKYFSILLNSLTHNDYSLKDSFYAATRINRNLPQVCGNDEYMFISLEVVSLFTNILSKKTVNIILKPIYNEKRIPASLSKRLLKKVIVDTCQKNGFFFQK